MNWQQTVSAPGGHQPPPAFALRMAALYSLFFAYVGLYLPYFPLWLKDNGLSSTQIALVLSLPMVVRVLTSGAISAFADRTSERANVLIFLLGGSAVCVCLYPLANGYWQILFVALLMALFNHPLQPVMDSITLAGVRRFGFDYGQIRLWGSVVFVIANLFGGWVLGGFGTGAIMALMIASALAGFILSPLTPRLGLPPVPAAIERVQGAGAWRLLANRRFMLVTVGCGIIQATHAMVYVFGSIHWERIGFSGGVIGMFWAVGVIAEIILFQFARQAFRRFSPVFMGVIGSVAGVVRWTLMPFDPGLWGFVLLQALHGLSFGATHLSLMHFYNDTVPEERMGSAQAVGFVCAAIAMGLMIFVSGPLYDWLGGGGFLAMAALSAIGGLLLEAARRTQPQRMDRGGDTIPSA